MRYLTAIGVFVFICLLGFFVGWIGGAEPFTIDAGAVAFCTLLFGGWAAVNVFLLYNSIIFK